MDSSLFVCFETLPFPFIGIIWKKRPQKRELEEETNPWERMDDLKEQEEKRSNKGFQACVFSLRYIFVSVKEDFCLISVPFGFQ